MICNLLRALFCIGLVSLLLASAEEAKAQAPTRFTVTVEGKGPDVILIPGLASSREVYAAEAKVLAPRYTLHLVQLNGFAGAPAGPNAAGPLLAPIVEELHGYIAAAKMHPAVIGHSLGGLLALMLADKYPVDVAKMMIVDSLPFYGLVFNPSATVETIKPQAMAMGDQMVKMPEDQYAMMQPTMMSAMVKNPDGVKAVVAASLASDRTVVVHAFEEDLATDIRADLPAMKTPGVMLYPVDPSRGQNEAATTALYSGAYSAMPSMKVVKVDDSRHFIMYDQPAVFDAQVQAFLK